MNIQSIPLFVQVAETLKTRIRNHEYGPGDAIPSAKALEKEFKVSNITIRRAVEQLSREGYLIPKRGLPPRVAELDNAWMEIKITGNFMTWIDAAVGKKLGIKAKLLNRQVIDCPTPIREILALDPTETVERIKRVREFHGEPISYYVTYGSSALMTRVPNSEIEAGSFVDSFQSGCKIKLKTMAQRVHASIADMDLAGILHVDFGFPLFFVQNVYYSEENKPMAITHMYYRSDRYVYSAKRKL